MSISKTCKCDICKEEIKEAGMLKYNSIEIFHGILENFEFNYKDSYECICDSCINKIKEFIDSITIVENNDKKLTKNDSQFLKELCCLISNTDGINSHNLKYKIERLNEIINKINNNNE